MSARALGSAKIKGITAFGDEAKGVSVIRSILERPLRAIAENAGKDANEVVTKLSDSDDGQGYDAATGEYGDMIAAGIIDPLKVVKTALVNAVSVASLILTTEAVVTDKPEPKTPPAGGPGMGGMGDY
jgi:chaperonin GroEL